MDTTLDLGDTRISWLNGGEFELDGGTMYGAVPKLLWSRRYPADADNCIRMLNASLLIRTPEARIVVDTGLGNKLGDKQKKIFRITRDWSLVEDLAALGIGRDEIDVVIHTHCDFDHAGGIVMHGDRGAPELTFPQARHVIQEREWRDVRHPNRRSAHTYWPDNFSGLAESGLLELVDGEAEIVPGVRVRLTGGHTRGHQIVMIQGRDACAVHLADLLPTHTHSNPLWIMAYDNFPLEVVALKEELLREFGRADCWFTFYHDVFMRACRLDAKGRVTAAWPESAVPEGLGA